MIEHTKKLVEDKFTVLGGYEHNAEVVIYNIFCFIFRLVDHKAGQSCIQSIYYLFFAY